MGERIAKGGAFPLLVESTPLVRGCICVLLFSALGLAGSHRWLGCSMGSTCSYGNPFFYFQGLTLVKQLFPAAGSLALGGGNTAPPK